MSISTSFSEIVQTVWT